MASNYNRGKAKNTRALSVKMLRNVSWRGSITLKTTKQSILKLRIFAFGVWVQVLTSYSANIDFRCASHVRQNASLRTAGSLCNHCLALRLCDLRLCLCDALSFLVVRKGNVDGSLLSDANL